MSAFVVSDGHIRFLVDMILHVSDSPQGADVRTHKGRKVTRYATTAQEVGATELGRILLTENYASVNYRYRENDTAPEYTHPLGLPHAGLNFDAAQVAKSVHCYQYQACEHPGWEESDAKYITDQLLQSLLTRMPGYEAAEWGAPKVYEKAGTTQGAVVSLTELLTRSRGGS